MPLQINRHFLPSSPLPPKQQSRQQPVVRDATVTCNDAADWIFWAIFVWAVLLRWAKENCWSVILYGLGKRVLPILIYGLGIKQELQRLCAVFRLGLH